PYVRCFEARRSPIPTVRQIEKTVRSAKTTIGFGFPSLADPFLLLLIDKPKVLTTIYSLKNYKIMKRVIIGVFVLLGIGTMQAGAQDITYGVKAEANMSNLSSKTRPG
ncbi:MAG: hypothetical protein LUD68_10665, partial [Rikenellaceae bacterium]|nr:hypothetical protein [Rikenellaceae bacterium]